MAQNPSATTRLLWIKQPAGIHTSDPAGTDASDGLVVDTASGTVVETVAAGVTPEHDEVFDARDHVLLPGLINTHHHFYQTLTRAHPAAINRELFDWLKALYPLWARLTPDHLRIATRLALTELMLPIA